MKLPAVAALAATFALAAAAPAAADSIAYVKGGDVWLATPDGARQAQITHTGGYGYVSQADDGTMIALAPGERLHKLSRTGQVLADFPTFVSDGAPRVGPVNEFHGPFTPEISPDGRLVAFEYVNESFTGGTTPACSETSGPSCHELTTSQGVGITHSDRFTPFEEYGLQTGWIYPHWIGNDRLLRSFPSTILNQDAVLTTVGPGLGDDVLHRWFYDETGMGVDDVELARDLTWAVGIAGQNDEKLRVYRPLMDPFTAPEPDMSPFARRVPVVEGCFELVDPVGGRFQTPTIAPDGRGLAYQVGDGIWVHPMPDLSAGCQPGREGRLAIPGGTHPDWGPANVPSDAELAAARQQQTSPGGGTRSAATPGGGSRAGARGPRAGGALKIVAAKGRLGAALRRGLPVTVRGAGGGRVTVTAKLGRRVVARAAAKAGAKSTAKLTLRFTRAGRRALAGRRSARLTLTVSVSGRGAAPATQRAVVTLKR